MFKINELFKLQQQIFMDIFLSHGHAPGIMFHNINTLKYL